MLARRFNPDDRIAVCGLAMGRVVVASPDRRGVRRLMGAVTTCSAAQVCPVCRVAPAMRRATELGVAVERWQARGFTVVLGTISLPNRPGNDPGEELQRLQEMWSAVSQTRMRGWRRRWKVKHFAWSSEATVSRRWWNVHRHVLLFVEMDPDELASRWEEFHREMFQGLREELRRTGVDEKFVRAWSSEAGLDLRFADDAEVSKYLSKLAGPGEDGPQGYGFNVGLEVTNPVAAKETRGDDGAIDPLCIPYLLDDMCTERGLKRRLLSDPDVQWLAWRWWEWRRAVFGTNLVQYSGKLREDLFPEIEDLSDEDLVELGENIAGQDRMIRRGGPSDGDDDPDDDPDGGEAPPEAHDVDEPEPRSEAELAFTQPLGVELPIWRSWNAACRGEEVRWGAHAQLCRLVETAGVWRAVEVLAGLHDEPVTVFRATSGGRDGPMVLVSDEPADWADPFEAENEPRWEVVPRHAWRRLADSRRLA